MTVFDFYVSEPPSITPSLYVQMYPGQHGEDTFLAGFSRICQTVAWGQIQPMAGLTCFWK